MYINIIIIIIIVFVVAAAMGEDIIEVGATYGSRGHHGMPAHMPQCIEVQRRAWADRFSSAPSVHDPPVGY